MLPGAGVPAHGVDAGGVHVNVNPFTGLTEELIVQVDEHAEPDAVVADQLVVVVLPWKSEVVAPVKPT